MRCKCILDPGPQLEKLSLLKQKTRDTIGIYDNNIDEIYFSFSPSLLCNIRNIFKEDSFFVHTYAAQMSNF